MFSPFNSDYNSECVQLALGIDDESERRWQDQQAEDIDTDALGQLWDRVEWDAIAEIMDTEKRMAIALDSGD